MGMAEQWLQPSHGVGWCLGEQEGEGSSQEPVEQLSPEAQTDGGVVDVEDKVLLRLEVQVRKCQLQVHHLDPAGEGTEMVGQTDGQSRIHMEQAALTG